MLSGSFMESRGEIQFPELKAAVLEKVIQYMYYKVRHSKGTQPPPEFEIEPEVSVPAGPVGVSLCFQIALHLLMAANYLDC